MTTSAEGNRRVVSKKEYDLCCQLVGSCPFCGAYPNLVFDDEICEWFVACQNGPAAGDCSASPCIGPFGSLYDAMDTWNRRKQPLPSSVFIITIDDGQHRYYTQIFKDFAKADILANAIRAELARIGRGGAVSVDRCTVEDAPMVGQQLQQAIERGMSL